jgi:hypothetical protein
VSAARAIVTAWAVVEVAPEHCPNGHPLGPGTVVVGWPPCQCVEGHSGHRTYYCRTCGVTMYEPPRTKGS